MDLPFTVEEFLQLFKKYNESIFPLQVLFYLLGFVIIFLVVRKNIWTDRVINSILTFFWLWMGIVYHLLFFTTINKAAYLFGSLFLIQAILFFYFGVIKQKLSYSLFNVELAVTGAILVSYALVVYPLLGYAFGHVYPVSPTFGVPCPTTIFTFGILLWSDKKLPKIILMIPVLWSLLGFSAATTLGIREDTALPAAGFITAALLVLRKKKYR